jgi:hypothetical protein
MQDETTASRWETIETRDSETRFDEDVEESIPGFHETDSGNADRYTSMTGGVPKSDGVLGWAEVDESNQQITRPVFALDVMSTCVVEFGHRTGSRSRREDYSVIGTLPPRHRCVNRYDGEGGDATEQPREGRTTTKPTTNAETYESVSIRTMTLV